MKPCNDGWTRLDLWTLLNIVEDSFENEGQRPSDMASDSSLRAHDERCQDAKERQHPSWTWKSSSES